MNDSVLGLPPLWIATGILVVAYLAVMLDRINRAVVAVTGACLVILLRILSQDQASAGIDFNTPMLQAGMMLIVGITRRSGVFEYVAIWSAKRVRAYPAGVLALLALVTAVYSMFLDNVTTVLLIVPVALSVTRLLRVDLFPSCFARCLEPFPKDGGGPPPGDGRRVLSQFGALRMGGRGRRSSWRLPL
jgi:Na+/H+ antiporter NhaD/arsenite permease-like protein